MQGAVQTTKGRPVVLGYYADWAETLPPQKIDYRLFTHLTHAFAGVDPGGTLRLPDPKRTEELCGRAHAAGVKVLLAVGGADSNRSLSPATATPDKVKRMADEVVRMVRARGYDGIDIDWEALEGPADRDRMNLLVKAVRERLPAGAPLTMAVPGTDWQGKWFDTAALLPYVDLLNVMAYDLHGSWSDHAGHNAPLTASRDDSPGCREATVMGTLGYWRARKWPMHKLLLGMPLYGRGFRAARWGAATRGAYERSEMAVRDIRALPGKGWKAQRDVAAQASYLCAPDSAELISYDDPDMIRRKAALAKTTGLSGFFFWEISQDFDGRSLPTVRAARDGWAA